jgi:hypothetical protein
MGRAAMLAGSRTGRPAANQVLMATTIRITLVRGVCQQRHYPPSPRLLLQTLAEVGSGLEEVMELLAARPPRFHLPYGQIDRAWAQGRSAGGAPAAAPLALGSGAAIHVSWAVDLSAEQERQLNAALAELRWLGESEDTALWQVVPATAMPEPNCVPAADGTLQLPGKGHESTVRYRYSPSRQLPRAGAAATDLANRALYGVETTLALPSSAGIAWTDRLHRALLRRAPGSSLFSGLVGGRPLAEDQRAWYRWEASQEGIAFLEVFSPQAFNDEELEGLTGLRTLFGPRGMRVPLRLLQLDALAIPTARRVRTATPMLPYTTPRAGRPQRSPAAQAIQTLLWGLGEQGKISPEAFETDSTEDEARIEHPQLGRLSARTWGAAEENLVACRGDRRAASTRGYHAELNGDQPMPLLAVGWGRHFGAGRLVAVKPG